jgi:transcriptional regulator with XRE-family HTH domain
MVKRKRATFRALEDARRTPHRRGPAQRRLELGLSQRDLAGPGTSYAYISRIERGQRRPSVRALRQLAPKLKVSVEWLETGEDNPADELAELVLANADILRAAAIALAERVLARRSG